MTADPDAVIARLLAEAAALPYGPARTAVVAEAAAVADAARDVRRGFAVRKVLLDTALGGGQPDELTVAFAWCLAHSDRDPAAVPPPEILWQYRWAVHALPDFAEVPRRQIEDALADMTRRYRAAGSTLRAVHLLRMNTAVTFHDGPAADAAAGDWRAAPRDRWADDAKTERSFLVDYHAFAGRDGDAVALCPHVLAGRVDSAHFFGEDSARLLGPLLNLGRAADAARVQRSGYRYVARRHRYVDRVGLHVEFLARVDDFPAAVTAFADHAPLAADTKQLTKRFELYYGGLVLAERLRRAGHDRVKMRLPAAIPVAVGDRQVPVADLADWLRADLAGLAARFDARNGNAYLAGRLAAVPDLAARPAPALP